MSLLFDSYTECVDCGSRPSLDNMPRSTRITWVYPATLANDMILSAKSVDSGSYAAVDFTIQISGGIELYYSRSTWTNRLRTVATNGTIATGSWYYIAGIYNSTGTNSDQKLYVGTLNRTATEPSYAEQLVGSGTHADDSPYNFGIGNYATMPSWCGPPGTIAWHAVWNRPLTINEIRKQQYVLDEIVAPESCVLFVHLGIPGGVGQQIDWSNRGNHGTVTGATVANHLPIPINIGKLVSRLRLTHSINHPVLPSTMEIAGGL